ncbi:unnamed protein product [Fraxinus pennsylvanica]|uniref:Cupin type-1 domain-containing protein n=1 Tax=Fraxinus pennsylvanica TaxID=56036 RepID=A0AAD2AEH3_9LAMI|nr:unnamed protein product [Fraxinus pennsylvanica]
MIYVIRGSGRIQIVGLNGQIALNSKMEAGQLLVVPKFFVAVQIADAQGMECFSVVTSSRPIFGKLAGNASVWKTLPSSLVQASLNKATPAASLIADAATTLHTKYLECDTYVEKSYANATRRLAARKTPNLTSSYYQICTHTAMQQRCTREKSFSTWLGSGF